jgi:hypothetical protein
VLVLQQPVQGVGPMGLPSAGAADGLAHGTQLTTLGYGFTQAATADSTRPWFSSSYASSRRRRECSSESEVNRPDCFRIALLEEPSTKRFANELGFAGLRRYISKRDVRRGPPGA